MIEVLIDGVSCSKYNMIYIPDNSNMYQFSSTSYKPNEVSFDARNGGLFYGGVRGIKQFNLKFVIASSKCDEQLHMVNQGHLRNVQDYFRLGRQCTLQFSDLNFIKYSVVITSIKQTSYTNLGAIVEVVAKAYDSCGYSSITNSSDDIVRANSNLLPATWHTCSDSQTITTSGTNFYVYNAGTVSSGAIITIGANSYWNDVLTIANIETGEAIELYPQTALGSMLTIDSDEHTITCTSLTHPYIVHKSGFINVEPGDKYFIAGSISGTNAFTTEEVVPSFINNSYIAPKATTISSQPRYSSRTTSGDTTTINFTNAIECETDGTLELVKTNRLYVSCNGDFQLNNFDVGCIPKYE